MQYRAVQSLKRVTDVDFGNDVAAWREYARGNRPTREPRSIAQRLRDLF